MNNFIKQSYITRKLNIPTQRTASHGDGGQIDARASLGVQQLGVRVQRGVVREGGVAARAPQRPLARVRAHVRLQDGQGLRTRTHTQTHTHIVIAGLSLTLTKAIE